MIVPLVLAALAISAPPSDDPVTVITREEAGRRLVIPDEIAPAVLPYMTCQLAAHGVTLGPPGAERIPAAEQRGADCSTVRKEAARNAERMLEQRGRNDAVERRAIVEHVLAKVEAFAAMSAPTPGGQGITELSVSEPTDPITEIPVSYRYPPYIEIALSPYAACLIDRNGIGYRALDATGTPAPLIVQKGGDCSTFRKQAAEYADRLLKKRGGMSAVERHSYIENALAELEEHEKHPLQ
jgi:hypothetical protein